MEGIVSSCNNADPGKTFILAPSYLVNPYAYLCYALEFPYRKKNNKKTKQKTTTYLGNIPMTAQANSNGYDMTSCIIMEEQEIAGVHSQLLANGHAHTEAHITNVSSVLKVMFKAMYSFIPHTMHK